MIVTPDTLAATFKAGVPDGAKLELVGDFPAFKLRDRTWAKPITLDCTRATLGYWYWTNVSGVRFVGGEADGLRMIGSRIGVSGMTMRWAAGKPTTAISISGGADAAVTDMEIAGYEHAVGIGGVDGFKVARIVIPGAAVDGVNIASSWNGLVEDVRVYDSVQKPTSHPDAVQMWSRATLRPTSDITIRRVQAVGNIQGISLFDHSRIYKAGTVLADGTTLAIDTQLPDGGFDRIAIEDCFIVNNRLNAIAVVNARGLTLKDNTVLTLPDATSQATIRAKGCTDVRYVGRNVIGPGDGKPGQVIPAS